MQGINVLDFATLAVDGAVTLVTNASPTLPSKCKRIYITSETDAVRWRADGTAPTSSEGHVLAKDDSISFTGANYRQLLESIIFIKVTTAATLKLTYFD